MHTASTRRQSGTPILIMHPCRVTSAMLCQLLESNGFEVSVTDQPVVEMPLLKEYSPRLVITSDRLTTATGEPVTAWVSREAGLPVVAVCESGDLLAGVRMLEMGADDFITTTQGGREILARVSRLIAGFARKEQRHTLSTPSKTSRKAASPAKSPDTGMPGRDYTEDTSF